MMEKRFQSQKVEQLYTKTAEQILGDAPIPKKPDFPFGTKFFLNDREWTVVKAWPDSGSEWRRLMSNSGDEQVVELYTLHRDMESPNFMFVELTDREKLMLKARIQN